MYKMKNIALKEVFRHLNRKLFNTFMDHLLYSLLFLMEFYRLCHHCEYIAYLFLLMQFFIPSKFKTFLKTVIQALSVLVLLFSMHYFIVVHFRIPFFYSLLQVSAQNFFALDFFSLFCCLFLVLCPMLGKGCKLLYILHKFSFQARCQFCRMRFYRQGVSFVACVFRHI